MIARNKEGTSSDALKRMNFAYQAAHLMLPHNPNLSRVYSATVKRISEKLVMRLSADIRRQFCKRCESLLIPGISCQVRIQRDREPHIVITCGTCGELKRFLLREQKHPAQQKQQEHEQSEPAHDNPTQPSATLPSESAAPPPPGVSVDSASLPGKSESSSPHVGVIGGVKKKPVPKRYKKMRNRRRRESAGAEKLKEK